MIASVRILSYWQMARLAPELPDACAVVSILNPRRDHSHRYSDEECPPGCGDLEAEPIFDERDPRVLTVRFWDVDDDDSTDPAFYREWPPVTQRQADAIAEFIRQAHEDPAALPFYAHCAGGISRSAGVAEVAGILAGIPFAVLKHAYPQIHPNATVKSRILRALRASGTV